MKARGDAVIFDESMGNAAFVSHQWVSSKHPDPDFEQMHVLLDALRRLLYSQGTAFPNYITEAFLPDVRGVSHEEFQARPLFVWYDYFSVPQRVVDSNQQAEAISSIPAYVAKCRFFLALCPTIDCPAQGKVLNAASWMKRGWCTLERAARELSAHDSWILVQGSASLQVVGTASISGSVGEGEFTRKDDPKKLAPVMRSIVKQKLLLSLKAGDMPSYRRHLNLQSVHLRGLEIEPVCSLLSDHGGSAPQVDDPVKFFLYQNGFSNFRDKDAAGFRPLHYAALSGNLQVVAGLLAQRAQLNQRTSKPEPKLGLPPWMSALDLAIFYKHNEAAQLLISYRADLRGGAAPSMCLAAWSNNPEGLRLLRGAGGSPFAQNVFGLSVLATAATHGSRAALEEMLAQAQHSPRDLSLALNVAMTNYVASAEIVERLLGLRADVDFQFDARRDLTWLARRIVSIKSLRHRLGQSSALSFVVFHAQGRTPLMAAMQNAQYEGAAALIAAGARLDLRNSRNWTAEDFAKGQVIPFFLQDGLKGDAAECERVTSLALPNGYVEMKI